MLRLTKGGVIMDGIDFAILNELKETIKRVL